MYYMECVFSEAERYIEREGVLSVLRIICRFSLAELKEWDKKWKKIHARVLRPSRIHEDAVEDRC